MITIGGWTRLEGTSVGDHDAALGGLYVLFAFLVARWNRGVLPVASALAIILAIFAAIAAPAWFARAKAGLEPAAASRGPARPARPCSSSRSSSLLIAVAMVGFNQEWHVEEERPVGGVPLAGEDDDASPDEERHGARLSRRTTS